MKPGLGLILIFTCFQVFAQGTFTLKGTVTDSSGNPVNDGLVSLFFNRDSAAADHQLIENGTFGFQNVSPAPYFIRVSTLGYDPYIRPVNVNDHTVLTVVLKRNALSLREIQVTENRQAFSYKDGNIKATIEHTPLNTLPDAMEVLSKLPTVQVSGDRDAVSIIGKGSPLIYLENQRITVNELQALSVHDIKSIEIINNPSAKYDAEGRAVILVTRKTTSREGFRIDANETASKKRYFENRAGVLLSLKKNITEWKMNLQYNHINRFEGLYGVLNEAGQNAQSGFEGTSVGPRRQLMFGLGVYHQLNATDYVSLNMNGRLQDEHADVYTQSYFNYGSSEAHTLNHNQTVNSRPFVNTNFNYQKSFEGTGHQLFAGAQYAWYTTRVANTIMVYDSLNEKLPQEERRQHFAVNVGTVRIDHEKRFTGSMVWENGAVWNGSQAATNFDVDYASGRFFHTLYNYRENNIAAYTQTSGKYHKLSYTAGVRVENTIVKGGYPDSSSLLLDKKIVYPFPRLSLSYQIDSNRTVLLSYTRSIRRPNYASANQVSIYLTPFLERTNNININPAVFDEVAFNYRYRVYSLKLNFVRIANSSSYIIEYDSQLRKYRMINRNIDNFRGVNLSLSLPVSYRIFSSNNEISVSMNEVNDHRAEAGEVQPFYYVYSFNQLKLPRGFTFMLTGWFTTEQYEGIFTTNGKYAVDLSLSKVFFKRLTCSISAYDIFRSLNNTESFTFNGIYMSTTYVENVKEFAVSVKYSFGRIKDTRFKNKDVNEGGNRAN